MEDKPESPAGDGPAAPRIVVVGIGGAGGNAVNNMIESKLAGVEFVVANTDAQALLQSLCETTVQLGRTVTRGLGAGSQPEVGRAATEEALEDVDRNIRGANMVFITAGMGGGTGTGGAPVIARTARDAGILTVGVVTKPFHFEGGRRMRMAEAGIAELAQYVDTLIVIPNQNLFRVANEKTTFAEAFKTADRVLHSGVRGVTDLMVMPGLINLDFADIKAVMTEMGKAIMGTGEAEGDGRALSAAEAAISNPLLDEMSMKGARGVLINISGGLDLTLFEVDQAANRIREEVDPEANIIFGSIFDPQLEGRMRVSVVATGIDADKIERPPKNVPLSLVISHSTARQKGAVPPRAAPSGDAPSSEAQGEAQGEAEAGDEGRSAAADAPRDNPRPLGSLRRWPPSLHPLPAGLAGPREDEAAAKVEETARGRGAQEASETKARAPGAGSAAGEAAATPSGAPEVMLKADSALQAGPALELREDEEDSEGSAERPANAGPPRSHRRRANNLFAWMTGGGSASADELFEKGDRYYYGQGVRKNLALALRSYQKAAELGHAAAQNRLGWMYEKGEGIEADYAMAVTWYRKAAEQGHVNAMNDLGYMYRQGWGVEQSHEQALEWFGKAAEKYDSYAEYNMGQMYENGWGVEKDLTEAIRWFRRSAARGHEWAAKRLEELGVRS